MGFDKNSFMVSLIFMLAYIEKGLAENEENSVQGRGRFQRIVVPILLAITIVSAIILPAILKIISLIAIKGLGAGVVSLIMAKMLSLKALLNHHHHDVHDEHHPKPPGYVVYLPHKHRREEDYLSQAHQIGWNHPWQGEAEAKYQTIRT